MDKPLNKRVVTNAKLSDGWTTYTAAAHGVLTAAGLTQLSLADFSGLTGMAFHLIMHKHCDTSSATVYNWPGRHLDALDRIGVLSEVYHYEPGIQTYEAARRRAIVRIQDALRQGTGVIAWGIDTGEFGVILGYDDEDGVFLVDGVDKFNRPLGSDPMLYQNLAKKFPPAPFLHYQIPLESVSIDLDLAYRRSLAFYVTEMEKSYHMSEDFASGFRAYDHWIGTLQAGNFNSFGLRYNTTVYAEAKCFAAEYVQGLVANWDNGIDGLDVLADHFQYIAKLYRAMMDVLAQGWHDGKLLGRPVTNQQGKDLIPLLEEARETEKKAVSLLRSSGQISAFI